MSEERERLENEKLRAETKKLETEVANARSARLRGWITATSVVVGIVFTMFQIYEVTSNVALKEQQLSMESRVRSHQLFLGILPMMSGFQSLHEEWDAAAEDWLIDTRERYGDVTVVGAYGSAAALACQFADLRLPAEVALAFQISVQEKDIGARTMLERIRGDCDTGWDSLTDEELQAWFDAIRSPDYHEM